MKYIRTENGIYEITDDYVIKDNKLYEKEFGSNYFDNEEIYLRDRFIDKIIKQADTIEELCDEIVNDDKRYNIYFLMNYCDVINDFRCGNLHLSEKNNYYGAIWTSKGLIYVAKMNEKGELELI